MMDIDKIKQKILDLAIRGKLVPQDPNDEPASVLVEKIKAEKEKMVKEGKIKPSKDESYIYKDSDNCYYEKKGNEVRDITSEIPFKIPNSWRWVRLKNIGTIVGGGTPDTSNQNYWNGDIVWITPANMSKLKSLFVENSDRKITSLGLVKSSAQLLPANSIIMSSRAPIGYLAINKTPACTSQGCKSLIPLYEGGCEYIVCALKARMSSIKSNGSGNTFSEISGKDFSNIIIPLPPSKEQKRIVEEYNAFVDKIDSIVCEYHQIVAISNHIKLKILDHFFGENSPYKSYYEKGVTKATQLSTVCKLYTGNSISKENKAKKYTFSEMIGLPYIGTKDVKTNNSIDYNNGVYIPPADQNDFAIAPKNSILLCIEGGSAGRKIAITNQNLCFGNKLCCFAPKGVETQYLFYFLQSNQFKRFFTKNTSGIIGGVSINKLRKIQINLPHYEEQQKIARLITKIFGNLNSIYE